MATNVIPRGLKRLSAVVPETQGRSRGRFLLLDDEAWVEIQLPVEGEH
jgi:hypothetical protein